MKYVSYFLITMTLLASNVMFATTEVNSSNFESVILKSQKPALVYVTAKWCTPCKLVSPIIDEISNEFNDKLTVGKVDLDSNRDLSNRYQVNQIPTLLFFKNGQVVKRHVGFISKSELSNLINTTL